MEIKEEDIWPPIDNMFSKVVLSDLSMPCRLPNWKFIQHNENELCDLEIYHLEPWEDFF